MTRRRRIAVLAGGDKGAALAEDLAGLGDVVTIVTTEPVRSAEAGPPQLRALADRLGAELVVDRRPGLGTLADVDVVFVAGWRYLVDVPASPPVVVLHDSLLPELRGFAPTVTALITGRSRHGVTALLPVEEVDAGPVLAQAEVTLTHPMSIRDALTLLRPAYLAVAARVLALLDDGPLVGTPQDESRVTYSIWRDESDLELDPTQDAETLVRTVLALGDPYPGARTVLGGQRVVVHGAEALPDVAFAIRQPGKVWRIDAEGPVIVCGTGLLRLTDVRTPEGERFTLTRLRTRAGGR